MNQVEQVEQVEQVRETKRTKQLQFAILNNVLIQSGIARRDFSLKGYSEDRVCLDYENGLWHVYVAERGRKYDLYSNKNFSLAAQNLIAKVASTPRQAKMMMYRYTVECKAQASLSRNTSHLNPDTQYTPIIYDGQCIGIRATKKNNHSSVHYEGAIFKEDVTKNEKQQKENHEQGTEFEN